MFSSLLRTRCCLRANSWRAHSLAPMSVAALGVSSFPSGQSLIHSSASKSQTPFLGSTAGSIAASSSSSSYVGEKLLLAGMAYDSRGAGLLRRNPTLVSPKAVSDSRDSQTCLDPPANKVWFCFIRCSVVFCLKCGRLLDYSLRFISRRTCCIESCTWRLFQTSQETWI